MVSRRTAVTDHELRFHILRPASTLRRGAAVAAACALMSVAAFPAHPSSAAPPAAAVTARPPLEAVPAAPLTRAQQARARQCAVSARSRGLRGAKREAFIKSCMAPPHPAPAARPSR